MTMKYFFLSSLPVDECAQRLGQFCDDHPLHFYSRVPWRVVGKIDGYEFTLRTSSHSNPNLFRGTLRPCPEGTLIEGDYHMHWAPKFISGGILGCGAVSFCVLGGAIVFGFIGMLAISNAPVQPGEELFPVLISAITVGLLLPLGGMGLMLVLFLARFASKKIWKSIGIPRITALMEEQLHARRVERSKVIGSIDR
jgi:hypothetical protein